MVISWYENLGIVTIDDKRISPDINTTLILLGRHKIELNLNDVELEYCLIKGKKMSSVFEKDFYVLDSTAYKKVNYFFSSIYSSLTKYKTCDIFMNSSSVYRFYSDVIHLNIDKDNKKSILVKKAVEYMIFVNFLVTANIMFYMFSRKSWNFRCMISSFEED